ncbi:MAG TPA: hypothetical protein VNM87_13800 [Candidatus Udaeobacter sp.]|nr:hypothetical protein [Candidatus Udaeobacter sp.]
MIAKLPCDARAAKLTHYRRAGLTELRPERPEPLHRESQQPRRPLPLDLPHDRFDPTQGSLPVATHGVVGSFVELNFHCEMLEARVAGDEGPRRSVAFGCFLGMAKAAQHIRLQRDLLELYRSVLIVHRDGREHLSRPAELANLDRALGRVEHQANPIHSGHGLRWIVLERCAEVAERRRIGMALIGLPALFDQGPDAFRRSPGAEEQRRPAGPAEVTLGESGEEGGVPFLFPLE